MKTAPIVPARLGSTDSGETLSLDHGEPYQTGACGLARARRVFLAGSGLPERWQGRDRYVVLETSFGLGHNFLATWEAWRDDACRCSQLVYLSIERHPLTLGDLRQVHHRSPSPDLAAQLCAAWPPLTPNLHRMVFEGDSVQLLLALGDVAAWLPELTAEADALFLDGFPPASNPAMWQSRLYKAMGRMAAPGATVAAGTASAAVRDGLASAGFAVHATEAMVGPGEITLATFAPTFQPKRPPARQKVALPHARHALVLGAGLAGCATVAALAEQGWRTTLVDRHATPAQEASGNPGGLFHGILHAHDGHHARFNRACALEATRALRKLLAEASAEAAHALAHAAADAAASDARQCAAGDEPQNPLAPPTLGAVDGILRVEAGVQDAQAMRAMLQRLGLPPGYVQALDADQASALAGLPLPSAAWFYPGGGWMRPAALARAWLDRAGSACRFVGSASVSRLHHDGRDWRLLADDGSVIAQAPALVLANAGDAPRLLEGLAPAATRIWPVEQVRGQLSLLDMAGSCEALAPRLPLAGAGYVLPLVDGQLVFGATAQPDDADAAVRIADHRHNLDRLAQLLPALASTLAALDPAELQGRTAWRSVASDRLPLIGAVPRAWVGGEDGGWDQPRFVPRQPGLFMFTALGSRGITWAPLGAQIVAAAITGAPSPLEAGLLDAIDPARWVTRAVRRRGASSAKRRDRDGSGLA